MAAKLMSDSLFAPRPSRDTVTAPDLVTSTILSIITGETGDGREGRVPGSALVWGAGCTTQAAPLVPVSKASALRVLLHSPLRGFAALR